MKKHTTKAAILADPGEITSPATPCSTVLGTRVTHHKHSAQEFYEQPLNFESDAENSLAVIAALHRTQQSLSTQLFEAILKKAPLHRLHALVEQGANVHDSVHDLSMAHAAVMSENTDALAFLVMQGAPVSQPGLYGNTPLHLCALECTETKLKLIHVLLIGGADVNAQNDLRQTPLHFHTSNTPEMYRKIASLLIQNGAHLHLPDIKGNAPLDTLSESERTALIRLALEIRGRM